MDGKEGAEIIERIREKREKSEILFARIRETLEEYGEGLSVSDAAHVLKRVSDELCSIACQTTDARIATQNYMFNKQLGVVKKE